LSSMVWIILVAALIGGFVYLKKHQSIIDDLLEKIFPVNHKTAIAKYKAKTEAEKQKADELEELLEAKKELMRARAVNIKLRKDIAATSSETDVLKNSLPSSKLKH
jgi:hypothetical protein